MRGEIPPLILAALSGAKTLPDVIRVWMDHRDQLRKFTYVVSLANAPNAMPWPARLDLGGKAFLRSCFGNNFIYILNDGLVERMAGQESVQVLIDYSIGFDNNTASYLRGVVEEIGDQSGRDVFRAILQRLSSNKFNWDLLPYMMERSEALLAGRDIEYIRSVVRAAETFAVCDRERFVSTGVVAPQRSSSYIEERVEFQMNFWITSATQGVQDSMIHQHGLFYAVTLKIGALQRATPRGRDAPKKTAALINWMCGDLGCMLPSMLWAATQYFERGGGFEFFRKLEAKKSELLNQARNVAWDAYHIYNRQQLAGMLGDGGCFTLPYFLTYDRGMAEVFDGFPQRGCFVHNELRSPQFLADRSIERDILERWLDQPELADACARHLTQEAGIKRRIRLDNEKPDIRTMIPKLEGALLALA